MLIFGGYEEEIGLFSQDVHALDLNTLTWSLITPIQGQPPSFRDFHTATVYLDRYMFIFGGRGDRHGPMHTRNETYCNTLICLDMERQEWIRPKTHGEIPSGRRSHASFMHNSFMYVFGGFNGVANEHMNDFYRYDPENREWKRLNPSGLCPGPRRRLGCVVIDNRVFFFGGTSPSTQPRLPPPPPPPGEEDIGEDEDPRVREELHLLDHDDLFVLDMEPSLKTLCLLCVLNSSLDSSGLPKILQQELHWMKYSNKMLPVTPLSSG
jgi:N-acetylneuraminic acid mutarotase